MKKMLRFRKPFAVVLCLVLLTATAYAAGYTTKTITVTYKDIKLNIEGTQVTPKDANGAVVEPFIYNGTTYLPVRAVGQALGKQVSWDGNTNTVYIGTNLGQETFLMDVCPPYETRSVHDENTNMTMSGKSYGHGFSMYSDTGCYAYINLDGNYRTMEFDFGALDGDTEYTISYEIYLDGQLVKTITHEPGEMVKHYSVPLNNALQMKIVGAGSDYYWSKCGFANITVQ